MARNVQRPCDVSESIAKSLREVKEIRSGEKQARTMEQLFSDIEKWKKEAGG